jgi:hypothetical protein
LPTSSIAGSRCAAHAAVISAAAQASGKTLLPDASDAAIDMCPVAIEITLSPQLGGIGAPQPWA